MIEEEGEAPKMKKKPNKKNHAKPTMGERGEDVTYPAVMCVPS